MNRFIWAFAAAALVLLAVVGFFLLGPTAERPDSTRADQRGFAGDASVAPTE